MWASSSRQTASATMFTRNKHKPWENSGSEDPQWHFSPHNWVRNKHAAAGGPYFSAVENPVSVTLVLQYDLLSLVGFIHLLDFNANRTLEKEQS